MRPAIVRRELAQVSQGQPEDVVPANDNAPTHALWRRVVAAGIGALFGAALILVGLVCTGHAAETANSPNSFGQIIGD
jgi:hypothetical protein